MAARASRSSPPITTAPDSEAVTTASRGYDSVLKGVRQAFSNLNRQFQRGAADNARAVETSLLQPVRTEMPSVITTEAAKARAQVQPRWKTVLKWVLIIAVVVLVAVFAGPLVIGAVTGLAAGLGASAAAAGLIGTIVGGARGTTTTCSSVWKRAGLTGTEVKSLRDGRAQLHRAYGDIRDGEPWLVGASISGTSRASRRAADPDRDRKLLLHRREIESIAAKVHEKGLTLVPRGSTGRTAG